MSVNCRSSSRHPGTISCHIAAALTWPVFKIDWSLNSVVDSIGIACCHEARSLSPVGCPHRSLKSFAMQAISSKSLDEASRRASNALSRAAFERDAQIVHGVNQAGNPVAVHVGLASSKSR